MKNYIRNLIRVKVFLKVFFGLLEKFRNVVYIYNIFVYLM